MPLEQQCQVKMPASWLASRAHQPLPCRAGQQQQQQQRHGSAAATAGAAGAAGSHLVPRLTLAVHLQELIQQVVKLCSGVEQGRTQAEQLIIIVNSVVRRD